jgi:hypothetical protein
VKPDTGTQVNPRPTEIRPPWITAAAQNDVDLETNPCTTAALYSALYGWVEDHLAASGSYNA